MNNKKVAFISWVKDEQVYQEHLKHLDELRVPEGFEIEKIILRDVRNPAASYNLAIKTTEAKYKVYLHQETLIIHKNFLLDLIKLFKDQPRLGMIGALGSKTIPTNGVWWDSNYKCGKIYEKQNGTFDLNAFAEVQGKYEKVRALDGILLATQYDVPWREDLFDTQLYSELAQVLEFNRAGYEVAVPRQVDPWCCRSGNFFVLHYEDEAGRNQFLDEYSKDLFPLVSILIPTHNRPHYLELALNTALKQTYRNTEIIISDNGDDEVSRQMLEPYLEKHSKIKYYRKKGMTGEENWQKCQELATGEYRSFLMDDDLFHPDKTMKMMHYFLEYENIGLVTSYRQLINETGAYLPSIRATRRLFDQDTILNGNDLGNDVLKNQLNVIGEPTTVLFKAEDVSPGFGYYLGRKYTCIADVATWLKMIANRRCVYLSEALSFFRLHQGQDQQRMQVQIDGTAQWWHIINDSYDNGLFITNRTEHMEAVSYWTNWAVPLFTAQNHLIKSQNLNVDDFCHCIEEAKKKLQSKNLPADPDKPLRPTLHRQQEVIGGVTSIIILTFNQLECTKKCVKSLQIHTPEPHEIVFVDNGSTDDTVPWLKGLVQENKNYKLIENKQNFGFAKACNQGAQAATTDYLVFLNNDTEPTQGWLEKLVEILDHDDSVAAVGSKLLYPDGTIQHAGIVLVDDRKNNDALLAKNNHAGKPSDAPEANTPTLYQALTAACVLIRNSAFIKAGCFDERYWNGYEDVDLCFKLQEQGGKLVYQPSSVVIHHESQSGPERFAKASDNIARLHKKWLGKIKPDIILNKDGNMILTDAGKIRPYSATGLTKKQLMLNDTKLNLVSIIILAFNQLEHTKPCLQSIEQYTPQPHELIIVDNGSSDGTLDYLRNYAEDHKNVYVISNKENLGFAAGNNQGLALANGNYLLLLNNDTVVTEGWLARMLSVFERYPELGIVGPVSNNVSGPQQVKGASYQSLAEMHHFAKQWSAEHVGQSMEFQRVVGFCLLAKREVIDRIGGLDEKFGSGNFEDDDFCLRAAAAGYKARIALDAFIHHTGSQTFKGAGIDYRKSLLRNWEIFKTKWKLPQDLPYGANYTLNLDTRDLSQYYIPLPPRAGISPLIINTTPREEAEDTVAPIVMFEKMVQAAQTDGNWEQVIHLLTEELNLSQTGDDAVSLWNDLGYSYFMAGQPQQAEAAFGHGMEINPNNLDLLNNLASFYLHVADYDKATDYVNRALRLNPHDVGALRTLGDCAIKLAKFDVALRAYEHVKKLSPADDGIDQVIADLTRLAGAAATEPDKTAPNPTTA